MLVEDIYFVITLKLYKRHLHGVKRPTALIYVKKVYTIRVLTAII